MRNPVRASFENWLRRLVITLAVTVLGAASPLLQAQCNLDVDANGQVDALTDGLLIMRAGMGLTGTALTQGALAPDATRTDPTLIVNFINANKPQYDLDGNGAFAAPTDAMMLLRYMFGHSGTALTDNAVGTTPVRPDWTAVSGYLQSDCGVSPTAAQKDAARLLTQATWGPKYTEIFALAGSPAPQIDNWITNQFSLPRLNHIDWILARFVLGPVSMSDTYESFWRQALAGADQLRQRVAFALSQILVVSNQKDGLDNP
ncbi:MAG: hypothetical protein ABJB04_04765, partial [Betaproteobacteria bacterium]